MTCYLGYEKLEKKIRQIKSDVETLCHVVDGFSQNDVTETNDNASLKDSISSYHTAIYGSYSSLDSFVTAVEDLDDERSELLSERERSIAVSQTSKKSVSFSKQIVVLDTFHRESKKKKATTKIYNIKKKFIDYISREKFYLRYKWQKLTNNIKHNNNTLLTKSIEEIVESGCNASIMEERISEKEQQGTLVNLKIFFNECITNFVLETDIDDDSLPIIQRNCSFPQTDLSTPNTTKKSILNAEQELIVEEEEVKIEIKENDKKQSIRRKALSIEPKYPKMCDESPKTNSFSNDVLFNYLVSKAQYPIQMKIANSIVKLNLPMWYQISLIE